MNIGFNFGDEMLSDMGTVGKQLDVLSSKGVKNIRLAYLDDGFQVQSQQIALLAKSKGFYVIYGSSWNTFTTTSMAAYTLMTLKNAKWAEANGIDQIGIGNEQEYRLSGVTQQQWASFLNDLTNQVRVVAPHVKISYETSGDFADFWATQTYNFDLLGLNLYAGYGANSKWLQENITAHGVNKVFVSEVNSDMDTGRYETDSVHATEVMGDAALLAKNFPNTQVYFFTFSANGNNGVPNNWGVYSGVIAREPLTAKAIGL